MRCGSRPSANGQPRARNRTASFALACVETWQPGFLICDDLVAMMRGAVLQTRWQIEPHRWAGERVVVKSEMSIRVLAPRPWCHDQPSAGRLRIECDVSADAAEYLLP
jgi:hypothetical protein